MVFDLKFFVKLEFFYVPHFDVYKVANLMDAWVFEAFALIVLSLIILINEMKNFLDLPDAFV